MTLCDAGPLVALVDETDQHHVRCVNALNTLPPGGLLTTWACLVEAMHLLWRGGGWTFQEALWSYFDTGLVRLHPPAAGEWQRIRELMHRYADTPMDIADASLVTAAEELQQRRIFTIDRHFYIYRPQKGQAFQVVP